MIFQIAGTMDKEVQDQQANSQLNTPLHLFASDFDLNDL